jgi:hypothetical protein
MDVPIYLVHKVWHRDPQRTLDIWNRYQIFVPEDRVPVPSKLE